MTQQNFRHLDGVLLFNKPLGISSNDALQKVRRLFCAKKAGHTGTLDPLASGLLPICFGEATKFSNLLLNADKSYQALIRLGQVTTTGDAEGQIISESSVNFDLFDVERVLSSFVGQIKQIPPMHSAIKHQGKPLYEYIRRGQEIEREPRTVFVRDLNLISFNGNELNIKVSCSKGTYIRTLAEDIGAALGCGAHLIGLCRISIGHFDLHDAYDLLQITEMSENERASCILPLESLMPDMPCLDLNNQQVMRLAQGQRLDWGNEDSPGGKFRLHGPSGFIGVGVLQEGHLSPGRLLSKVAIQAARTMPEVNIGVE